MFFVRMHDLSRDTGIGMRGATARYVKHSKEILRLAGMKDPGREFQMQSERNSERVRENRIRLRNNPPFLSA